MSLLAIVQSSAFACLCVTKLLKLQIRVFSVNKSLLRLVAKNSDSGLKIQVPSHTSFMTLRSLLNSRSLNFYIYNMQLIVLLSSKPVVRIK